MLSHLPPSATESLPPSAFMLVPPDPVWTDIPADAGRATERRGILKSGGEKGKKAQGQVRFTDMSGLTHCVGTEAPPCEGKRTWPESKTRYPLPGKEHGEEDAYKALLAKFEEGAWACLCQNLSPSFMDGFSVEDVQLFIAHLNRSSQELDAIASGNVDLFVYTAWVSRTLRGIEDLIRRYRMEDPISPVRIESYGGLGCEPDNQGRCCGSTVWWTFEDNDCGKFKMPMVAYRDCWTAASSGVTSIPGHENSMPPPTEGPSEALGTQRYLAGVGFRSAVVNYQNALLQETEEEVTDGEMTDVEMPDDSEQRLQEDMEELEIYLLEHP